MSGGRRAGGYNRGWTAEQTAAHRERCRRAAKSVSLPDIIGPYTTLKRAGKKSFVGLCPFHTEKSPSFHVYDDGTYHCYGCSAFGDAIDFYVRKLGMSHGDALRELEAGNYPVVDPADRARRAKENEADRAAAIEEARRIWSSAAPAAGTPAEVYARSRGIIVPLPPSIRFAHTYAWVDKETGEFGPDIPAVIGAVTIGDQVVAIQRIFLSRGGRAKANLKKPKLSLGRVKGGALRLDTATNCRRITELMITEGPEDGWSLMQEFPEERVWVALGTGMMPEIEYPEEVKSITIAGQNDAAGRAAATKATTALVERGYAVKTIFPPADYKDWNDALRGIRS